MCGKETSLLPKKYDPAASEARVQDYWERTGVYHFQPNTSRPIFSIDTPPPTVSGNLHLGHAYSYSHADFFARYWRMRGHEVYYPMGFDDNGLPTERLVERRLGILAADVGRQAFIEKCLQVSGEAESDYQRLWRRLGLSIDWRHVYRTIDDQSRQLAQWSFIDLFEKGLVYQQEAPTIWCPDCRTAIAQAELKDLARQSDFYTLRFTLHNGDPLPIATTRPELLPACVAVLIHPTDSRARGLEGTEIRVPLFDLQVPVIVDESVDPEVGTGVVMCCTFGDAEDIAWWHRHDLPLRIVFDGEGRLNERASPYEGLVVQDARQQIVADLEAGDDLLERRSFQQSVRAHERCDTVVEYLVTRQWFIRILEFKEVFLEVGNAICWHPAHMQARYIDWVKNLHWDWCISRQRFYGVPFPVWYCQVCGEVILADVERLPVDPLEDKPGKSCKCGSREFLPEEDVMDTWATSSLSPQIVEESLAVRYPECKLSPMSMRPQAHEIIRTWAFYTIVKSHHHFSTRPWENVVISGWGLSPRGTGKISKSRGSGPLLPLETIERYSADAVRYWAASTGLGKDSIIREEKIQDGARLATKLWNVARFSQQFLIGYQPHSQIPALTSADRWILSRTLRTIQVATKAWEQYDYLTAKSETEAFFWGDLADNYLEWAKQRLYSDTDMTREGACYALYHALSTVIKLFAPILPFVTEEIHRHLYAEEEGVNSIHRSRWPEGDPSWYDERAEIIGEAMLSIVSATRRYKSERRLSLATEIARLQIVVQDPVLNRELLGAEGDLISATRSSHVELVERIDPEMDTLLAVGEIRIGILMKHQT